MQMRMQMWMRVSLQQLPLQAQKLPALCLHRWEAPVPCLSVLHRRQSKQYPGPLGQHPRLRLMRLSVQRKLQRCVIFLPYCSRCDHPPAQATDNSLPEAQVRAARVHVSFFACKATESHAEAAFAARSAQFASHFVPRLSHVSCLRVTPIA